MSVNSLQQLTTSILTSLNQQPCYITAKEPIQLTVSAATVVAQKSVSAGTVIEARGRGALIYLSVADTTFITRVAVALPALHRTLFPFLLQLELSIIICISIEYNYLATVSNVVSQI